MNQFKIINEIKDDTLSVKESIRDEVKVYSCKEFEGEFSSTTGIYSKFAYIGRISQHITSLGEPMNPTIRIVCGPECIDKCINQPRDKTCQE